MLGWDTDMFPNDVGLATYIMDVVLKQGGLAPGGLNFDAKVRRESTDVEDLFIGHINGMDTYARGLRNAARMQAEGTPLMETAPAHTGRPAEADDYGAAKQV